MKLGRREFVKLTAAATAASAFGGLGFDLAPTKAHAQLMSLRKGKETTSVCCYCSVGCGLIVTTDEKTKRAINIEGDPLIDDDFAYATREGLVPHVIERTDVDSIRANGLNGPFAEIRFDIHLTALVDGLDNQINEQRRRAAA